MAKFVFRLQSLLNVKIQLEKSLKDELGKAVAKVEEEKSKLAQIENDRENYINQVNNKSAKGIRIGEIREFNSYIVFLREKIEFQKENIKKAQKIVDKYREQLVKVVQEKKMLEKYKEKQYQQYLKEQQGQEQKLIDEIVSFNYNNSLAEDENG